MRITSFFKLALMAVFFTALTTSMTSCSDDDDDDNGGGGTTTSLFVPDKITIDDEGSISSYTISYDDKLRITGIEEKYNDSDYSHKLEYDAEGRISKLTYSWDTNIETYTYTYANNTVTVLIKEGEIEGTRVYTLNSNGLPTSSVYSDEYNDEKKITYKYDDKGRVIQRIGEDENVSPYYITYNEEVISIGKNINVPSLMAISLSLEEMDDSVISLLLYNDKSVAKTEYSYHSIKEIDTYTYKVNSNGYPESYKLVNSSNGEESVEYTASITYKEIKK
ncbi:MAG: hypothetical protein E6772_15620 [Dysgonomonas sp.]|nr:hypothetical protein [Dysgonomonas sp.]